MSAFFLSVNEVLEESTKRSQDPHPKSFNQTDHQHPLYQTVTPHHSFQSPSWKLSEDCVNPPTHTTAIPESLQFIALQSAINLKRFPGLDFGLIQQHEGPRYRSSCPFPITRLTYYLRWFTGFLKATIYMTAVGGVCAILSWFWNFFKINSISNLLQMTFKISKRDLPGCYQPLEYT